MEFSAPAKLRKSGVQNIGFIHVPGMNGLNSRGVLEAKSPSPRTQNLPCK